MDLQADIARRVKKDSKAGLPPGGLVGRALVKASGADYDCDWMPVDGGLPPGGVAGDVVTKVSYVDGDAEWAPPSAGSGFPISYDDGTYTYTVDVIGGALVAQVVQNAGTVLVSQMTLGNNGLIEIEENGGGIVINDPDAGGFVFNSTGGEFFVETDGGNIRFDAATGGFLVQTSGSVQSFDIGTDPGAGFEIHNLPTSDPGVSGRVYVSAGVLMVSP